MPQRSRFSSLVLGLGLSACEVAVDDGIDDASLRISASDFLARCLATAPVAIADGDAFLPPPQAPQSPGPVPTDAACPAGSCGTPFGNTCACVMGLAVCPQFRTGPGTLMTCDGDTPMCYYPTIDPSRPCEPAVYDGDVAALLCTPSAGPPFGGEGGEGGGAMTPFPPSEDLGFSPWEAECLVGCESLFPHDQSQWTQCYAVCIGCPFTKGQAVRVGSPPMDPNRWNKGIVECDETVCAFLQDLCEYLKDSSERTACVQRMLSICPDGSGFTQELIDIIQGILDGDLD